MKKGFVLILVVIFMSQNVLAEELVQDKMDFFAAVKYSLLNNNNIRAMRDNLSATEKDIGIARSVMLPKLVFNEDFTSTNNPTQALSYRLNQARATAEDLAVDTLNHPNSVPNFLTAGTIEQRFFDRKAMIAIKMAKKEYSANGYVYIRKQEELVNQVAQACLKVHTDKDVIDVMELGLKDAKGHLEIAQGMFNKKAAPESDVLRAKSAVDQREQKLVSAKRALEVSKRNLGLLLGLETSIELSGSVPDIKLNDIDYYKNFAPYRSDIKAMEIRVQNAKNNISSAQSEWFPTLTALGSYNFYNANYPFGGTGSNYFTGAFFRWEIFDGNKRKYDIAKAKDKEAEAKEYLIGLRKSVNFRIFEVYSEVGEHQRNLELAISAKKSAKESHDLIEEKWSKGLETFQLVIDTQEEVDRTRLNLVKNQFDLKEDLITLTYESGIIYQELNIK